MLDELAAQRAPVVIGVRHHSAALSAVMGPLLDRLAPTVLYLEAPPELESWFGWLGHPELQAPVVLAAARPGRLGFYPFADFSPELAAVRWAVAHDVPVRAIDAPVQAVLPDGPAPGSDRFGDVLKARGVRDLGDFWDQEIESRAHRADPEALRRAALAVGLALREAGPTASDAVRESCMRKALAGAPEGSVAVVGSFHAAALYEGPDLPFERSEDEAVTSLIPYTWGLFDQRSGYPAGVKDPALQQQLFEAYRDGVAPREVLASALVAVLRDLREQGHNGGMPDGQEALRMTLDLALLRGRAEPGRLELVEAIESTMARGQRYGRGAALARSMQRTLVGNRRGAIAAGTPLSGLRVHLEERLQSLKLPGPGEPARTLRLDPLRSDLDRARQIGLLRMGVAQIEYGQPAPSTQTEALGATWTVEWTPGTAATASLSGVNGVTLQMASGGRLKQRWAALASEEQLSCTAQLQILWSATDCGVLGEAGLSLSTLWSAPFVDEAGLADLVQALRLIARIEAGHSVGTSAHAVSDADPQALYRSGVRQIEALAGSTDVEEVVAMAELVRLLAESPLRPTLERALGTLASDAAPLMQGAARALEVVLGGDAAAFGVWLASCVAGAGTPDARTGLQLRLRGALLAGGVAVESDPRILNPIEQWVEEAAGEEFMPRLPALRGGFDVLSPVARQRVLDDLKERYGEFDDTLALDPSTLSLFAEADRRAASALGLASEGVEMSTLAPELRPSARGAERWRLILGREKEALTPASARAARSLDELYGAGRGEGSRGEGGGDQAEPLTAREWSGELEHLFGARVRDEVLAAAGESGRAMALAHLEPDEVRPSVELLRQLLSLAGSLGEGRLEAVRRLVRSVVEELVKELAVRVRPAVTGASSPRPTRRPTGRLDLARTVRRNLSRVRVGPDGPQIVPESLIFRSASQRTIDWRLHLVVDVSGSMDASVLYSAMMAAILSSVPWIGVRFTAFNTEVIDLSDHVEDPLSLLLEVDVGGGTDIGKALRYVAGEIAVPSRSMVVVVSDFEEGGSVPGLLAAVRDLVASGVQVLGVAALDDEGAAAYHAGIARQIAALGVPVAAVSPLELARWVGEVVHG